MRLTRRKAIKLGCAAVAGASGLGAYATFVEPFWTKLEERSLPIAGLPTRLSGKRLLQLSDLHIGSEVPDTYLLEQFARCAALEPDIVVCTGDFVTWEPGVFERARRLLPAFPQGGLATLAVLGNHDYGSSFRDAGLADELAGILAAQRIRILRNEVVEVEGLQILGTEDLWSGRFDIARTVAQSDPARPRLALCHNPDGADQAGWSDYRGWILAGHTHGGQCKPPFLPPPLLPVQNKAYTAGLIPLADGRTLYINRGLGYLRRVRCNVRPEIALFTLAAA